MIDTVYTAQGLEYELVSSGLSDLKSKKLSHVLILLIYLAGKEKHSMIMVSQKKLREILGVSKATMQNYLSVLINRKLIDMRVFRKVIKYANYQRNIVETHFHIKHFKQGIQVVIPEYLLLNLNSLNSKLSTGPLDKAKIAKSKHPKAKDSKKKETKKPIRLSAPPLPPNEQYFRDFILRIHGWSGKEYNNKSVDIIMEEESIVEYAIDLDIRDPDGWGENSRIKKFLETRRQNVPSRKT